MGIFSYREKKIKYYEFLLDYIQDNYREILVEAIKEQINCYEKGIKKYEKRNMYDN